MRLTRMIGTLALVTLCALTGLSAHAAQAKDVCVSAQGKTQVTSGTATCTADQTSVAVAVNGSTATAGWETTTIAVNGSTAAGYYGLQVIAVNDSTALANTDAVREKCSQVAVNGETATCP